MNFGPNPIVANVSQSDMAALKRILSSLDLVLTAGKAPGTAAHISEHHEAVTLARRLKAARNQRARLFQAELFGEPAWDMMLALYLASGEGYRLKITDLCEESGVSATTALRWIAQLTDLGLARRVPNPMDARSVFIEATDLLGTKLTEYLRGVLDRQLMPKAVNG